MQCCLYNTVLKEKTLLKISGAKLFLTLKTSFNSACKLRWCFVKNLSFFKSSEKVEVKSLYTSLSAVLYNPLIRLLITISCFIQTNGQNSKWDRKEETTKKFLLVTGIYGKTLVSPRIFFLALLHKFITCFLKFSTLLIITRSSFSSFWVLNWKIG